MPEINETTLKIIWLIVTLLVGGFTTYFKTNAKLKEKTNEYIADAEMQYSEWTHAGKKKFELVVDRLYSLVPVYLKPIITRDVVSTIVQQAFNSIQSYTTSQLDKCLNTEKITHEDGR